MPQLFVVTDQKTVKAVATAVLAARTSASRRAAAIEAIRAANPALDLDHLERGATLVIPAVPGLRRDEDDHVGEPVEEVAARAREGIAALAAAADRAEEQRLQEKKQAQELFQSAAVKRIAHAVPELGANIESVRATFKEDDAAARRQQADLATAAEEWAADLEVLRGLL